MKGWEIVDIEKLLTSIDEMADAFCPLCGNRIEIPEPIEVGCAFGRVAAIHRRCYHERGGQ